MHPLYERAFSLCSESLMCMSTTVASRHNPEAHNPKHVMNNKPQRPNVHVRVWVKVSTRNELSTSLTCINLEEEDAFHHTQNLLCKIVQGQDAISKQKQCSAEKTTCPKQTCNNTCVAAETNGLPNYLKKSVLLSHIVHTV